ncbi:MAG: hypothetical protein U9Q61_00975, partial [Thermodesulfobacteriota bacterium]|nr:hypothetical protein [Thermodesulfobacteriota bacterium]
MKIRGKFIIPIAILVVLAALMVIISVGGLIQNQVQENETVFADFTDASLKKQATKRQATIQGSIDTIGVKALEMAAVFSKVPDVLTAYRLALLGDLEDENDHEMQMAR